VHPRALLAFAAIVATAAVAACASASPPETRSSIEYGRVLFRSTEVVESKLNSYTCATCHRSGATDRPEALLSGGSLAGVAARTSYWAGQEPDFLAAVNHCRIYFMRAGGDWLPTDPKAQALFGYLASLPADARAGQNSDWVVTINNIPGGDAKRGESVYRAACENCHGQAQTGVGRLPALVALPALPGDTLREHAYLATDLERRVVFIEKTRHGGFFGYGGVMPPFARGQLSDADLASILAFLRVPDPR
jgi:thiosulfate dehydrogenase